jgi:hypothetical protein
MNAIQNSVFLGQIPSVRLEKIMNIIIVIICKKHGPHLSPGMTSLNGSWSIEDMIFLGENMMPIKKTPKNSSILFGYRKSYCNRPRQRESSHFWKKYSRDSLP